MIVINKYLIFIFIIYYSIFFESTSSYTPYSECSLGRITGYDEYTEGGSCGFGVPKIYGAAPNEAFYNDGEKCGICYEMVGPNGVLFFMVDSHCPVKGNEKSCSGDMLHFDLHRNGFRTIIDDEIGRTNVTFRMVSCDHKSNMILKTKKEVTKYYFSFVILYHNIGLKKIYFSYDKETWTGLEREGNYNHWTINNVNLPLYLQFESISGEKVQTVINEIIADHEYDTGVQFSIPNKFYDPFSLKEIESPKVEGCCKLHDAFTDIYYEGEYLGEWQDVSNCELEKEYSTNCYEGSKCIKINLIDWSVYQFFNRVMPETKKYSAIKFMLKSESFCDKCLKIKLDEYEFYSISTKEAGKWEEKIISLKDLGLSEATEKFRKFMFQGSKKDSQIFYFDNIQLVKSDYNDQGLCHANTVQNLNISQGNENDNQNNNDTKETENQENENGNDNQDNNDNKETENQGNENSSGNQDNNSTKENDEQDSTNSNLNNNDTKKEEEDQSSQGTNSKDNNDSKENKEQETNPNNSNSDEKGNSNSENTNKENNDDQNAKDTIQDNDLNQEDENKANSIKNKEFIKYILLMIIINILILII